MDLARERKKLYLELEQNELDKDYENKMRIASPLSGQDLKNIMGPGTHTLTRNKAFFREKQHKPMKKEPLLKKTSILDKPKEELQRMM